MKYRLGGVIIIVTHAGPRIDVAAVVERLGWSCQGL